MSSLEKLTDQDLSFQLKQTVREEKEITLKVLRLLREVEKRRLFAKRGFSSLFEFAVKELAYSESAAGRRISAMRLIKEIPSVEEKIQDGKLNLSTANKVAPFFCEEKKLNRECSETTKEQILQKIEGKSQREVERTLVELSPNRDFSQKEKQRLITPEITELKVFLNREQIKKLERLKQLRGNNKSNAQLIEWMLDQTLQKIDPAVSKVNKRTATVKKKKVKSNAPAAGAGVATGARARARARARAKTKTDLEQAKFKMGAASNRYIPRQFRRELEQRANSRCQYIDRESHRRCELKTNLQVDHDWPLALGGKTELKNLRMLCHTHNQLMAIRVLGRNKMSKFIAI